MDLEPQILDEGAISEPYVADLHMASAGTRLTNRLIDLVVCYILRYGILLFWKLPLTWNFLDVTDRDDTLMSSISLLIYLGIFFGYYFIMESFFGRTIGKLVTRTRVVDESGSRPTAGRIAGRTLARIIPFEPFSFFGNEPRGWHDTLSKTWVVKDQKNN